jgi:hypothetical protein
MKIIAWLAGTATLVVGAIYMIVSLNRWEWNRALFFGLLVLIAEVGLATGLILRKLAQQSRQQPYDPMIRGIIRDSRSSPPNRFRWLQDSTRELNVFITFLVGGGVVISGIAWVVDKVASKTSTPAGEVRLARQLESISYPRGGLLVDDITVLAQDVPGADDEQIRKLLRRAGHGS